MTAMHRTTARVFTTAWAIAWAALVLAGCETIPTIAETGYVTGSVTVDGAPRAGVQVSSPYASQSARTDGTGSFRLMAANGGPTQVSIVPPPGADCPITSITVAYTARERADFACKTPGGDQVSYSQVTGIVTVDGIPAAGVEVSGPYAHVVTGTDGRYELGGSSAGYARVTIVPPPGAACPVTTKEVPNGKQGNFECTRRFRLDVVGSYTHATGVAGVSFDCKLISTTPPQPGAAFSVTATGPGVIDSGPTTGALDGQGQARVNIRINQYGTYRNSVTVSGSGATVTTIADVIVYSAPSSCR